MRRLAESRAYVLLVVVFAIRTLSILAFSSKTSDIHNSNKRSTLVPTGLRSFHYARGADIWPECNPDPIQLQDSFPNGNIPYSAILEVDQTDMQAVHDNTSNSMDGENSNLMVSRRHKARFLVSMTVQRLLRRAAAKEELHAEEELSNASWQQSMRDRLVAMLVATVVLQGLIRPVDVLVVSALTSYYIILGMVARSPRRGGLAPIMPSMPPQGHVPTMVSNPLGMGVAQSRSYDVWLQAGVGLGIILPALSILLDRTAFRRSSKDLAVTATLCARPLFLLCCQVMSETYSKRAMVSIEVYIAAVNLQFWLCAFIIQLFPTDCVAHFVTLLHSLRR